MVGRFKEDEKNEKAIRVLLKKDCNRRCINCNSLGPQYVCLNFWTFVCTQCSGIHREFTHRVKSVSMSKFSSQEVVNLENGGNERGREIHFKNWDPQRQPLPDSSNVDRLRDFIKSVYVDQRYSGERPLPRSRGGDREEMYESQRPELRSNTRRDSRSPTRRERYEDHQFGTHGSKAGYEDHMRTGRFDERRTFRQVEAGRDRPGRSYSDNQRYADRTNHENHGRLHEAHSEKGIDRRSEGRLANEQQRSLSTREFGGSSPPQAVSVKEILGEDVPRLQVKGPGIQTVNGHEMNRSQSLPDARSQRFGSSSSFGSADGKVPVVKIENSGSLIDFLDESTAPAAMQQSDPFRPTPADQMAPNASSNTGWATFDVFSLAAAGPEGAAPTAVPSLSGCEGTDNLGAHSNGNAQWSTQWPSLQAAKPSSSLSRADSLLSFVETVSQPPISAGVLETQHSFSILSAPVSTTLLSAGQVQIVQDLPNANSSTSVPPAVSTTRQDYPEVGSYNQSQKSRNPFDPVGDSLTPSRAGEFPNMRPLQASLPNLAVGFTSVPGTGVSTFNHHQWMPTSMMGLQPVSYPPAAPSGGLFAGQHMPNMMPQIMKSGPSGPSMGAWPGSLLSTSYQSTEPFLPMQGYPKAGGVSQLSLETPLDLGTGNAISQDALFFSQAGQHFISQSALGSLNSIAGMSSLNPVQASPQFPAYNSVGSVSNPFA